MTDHSKRTISLRTLRRTLSLRNVRGPYDCEIEREPYQWGPSGASGPSITFVAQITLSGFLVIVYDRVDDWDKFLYKNVGLKRPHFHATNHLKVEAKEFF